MTTADTPVRRFFGLEPRRVKLLSILVGMALAGVVLLTYTQTWVNTHVSSPQGGTVDVSAAGSAAAPALSALAFSGLALMFAATIANHVIRVVLGVLEMCLGAGVVATALATITAPVTAAQGAITKVTGVDGKESVKGIVLSHATTPWPWVALVVGVAMAAVGLAVIASSRRWPAGSRRYQTTLAIDPNAPTDPVVAWDTLTTGADPTALREGERDEAADERTGPRP